MKNPIKYKCKSCGMIFFISLKKKSKKGKKDITCPYCESKLWHNLISK